MRVQLSDVEAGGATVFVSLGLRVAPVRGAALVWYNLHRSGRDDYRTKHAACPVLRGDRWGLQLQLFSALILT